MLKTSGLSAEIHGGVPGKKQELPAEDFSDGIFHIKHPVAPIMAIETYIAV